VAGGLRQLINAPDFTPLPNFLWDAAQKMDSATPHWRQGVTWQESCGDAATLYDECLAITGTGGAPSPMGSMQPTVTQTTRGATSFTVYAEFDCAPVGNMDEEYNQAEQALLRKESYWASRAFWTGQSDSITSVFPHLAANAVLKDANGYVLQTAASPYITGGDDVAVVLGALEQNLAQCYGGRGVIHIPYSALPTFISRMLCKQDPADGLLKTTAGNLVVPGPGYTGSAPDGSAAASGTTWIYATGAVFGFRGDVFIRDMPGTYDRAEGTIRKIASRTYLFGFECCHFGALLNLGVPSGDGK
jgi:hypothetical protein